MENAQYINLNFIHNYLDFWDWINKNGGVAMSNQNDKVMTTKVITKREVIKSLAEEFDMTIKSVGLIYNSLENRLRLALADADENTNVEFRLFDGIKIEGKMLPSKEKLNNLTGEKHFVDKRITAKASLSRRYLEKLNRKMKIT